MIVNVTVLVPVWLLAFFALRTTLYVPAVFGVPVIKPVALTLNAGEPGGSPVAPQLPLGMVWFAVIWYENATPTVPVALPLLTFGAAAKAVVASDIATAAERAAA